MILTSRQKRKNQNRIAQRAFRTRQRQHVQSLEAKLESVLANFEELQQQHTYLSIAYETILEERKEKANFEELQQHSRHLSVAYETLVEDKEEKGLESEDPYGFPWKKNENEESHVRRVSLMDEVESDDDIAEFLLAHDASDYLWNIL